MGHFNDKQIEKDEKEARRQRYLEDHPELLKSGCPNSFTGGRCTSGTKRGDYCDNDDPDTCPYN